MNLYDTLEDLCETVGNSLETASRKVRGGDLSSGDLDYIDKLTHTMKSIKTTLAMMGEGYSGSDGYMHRSPVYGYSRRTRDSRGRYSGRYSMDGGMVEELRELMQDAPDERTKQEFQRFISKLENM